MYPVELIGSRVKLREFRPDDLEDVTKLVGDDRVTTTLSFDSRSIDQAESMLRGIIARAALNPRTEFYLAAVVGEKGVIGLARLELSGVKAGKLGFAIGADHWGQGYGTDAARTITEFGFSALGLHRISAAIGPENDASVAIAKKLRMTYEGRIRDHVFTNGSWRDSLLYSVLHQEWRD